MNASLLLPITLLLLSLAGCVEIVRDVAFARYGQAMAGLLLVTIFMVAIAMSAQPLLTLLDNAI